METSSRLFKPWRGTVCGAVLSPCRTYRYSLRRTWDAGRPSVAVIGLNPSVADANWNDRTIAKLMRMANAWGFGGLRMVNLFAYRSTDRSALTRVDDPVGRDNDMHIIKEAGAADMVVCAWGADGSLLGRDDFVVDYLLSKGLHLNALKLTKHGNPSHPLYLPDAAKPFVWAVPGKERVN